MRIRVPTPAVPSGIRARRLGTRPTARHAWFTALALMMVLTALPVSAVAQEAGDRDTDLTGPSRYLAPASELLSGPSWMVAEGLDPRLFGGQYGAYAPADGMYGPGAPGGSYAAPAAQQVPFRSAAPAFSRNILLTRQVGYAPYNTEPHIAVNPNDPEHIVVGTIDYNFGAATAYVSFDGGETWDGPNPIRYFREDLAGGGDPVVTFDRQGNVYIAQLSLGIQDFVVGSLRSETVVSSIAVAKSEDGGLNWLEPAAAAIAPVVTSGTIEEDGRARGEITIPFLDKEWIIAGPNPEDPENSDLIHVSYTEFRTRYQVIYSDEVPFLTVTLTESVIKSVTSGDGGRNWSEPVAVSPVVFFAEGGGSPEGGNTGPVTASGPAQPRYGPATDQTPTAAAPVADDVVATTPEAPVSNDGDSTTPNRGGNVPATVTPAPGQTSGETPNRGRLQVGDEQAGGIISERVVQGSQPFVLSDGTVGVAYHDTTSDGFQKGLAAIQIAMSPDGGVTFDEPQQAAIFREVRNRPRAATFRLGGSGFPQVAVGPDDEIYIVHTRVPSDSPIDDGDTYLFGSFDRGQTWSDGKRVNGDDTDRPQFYPAVDVSEDGVVHIMWADMRDDPDQIRYHIYYTRSDDRGETFGFVDEELNLREPDTRVSDFATNALKAFVGGRFIGDYFGLAANNDDVYMVWADGRLGEFGGPNQQIGFARRTPINPPELFLNPPSGPAGRAVTIQGFGYQPEAEIVLYVAGALTATLRTDDEGFFTATIYIPVTGEGSQDIRAFDETGNAAVASFYTEFGFDSLQRGQATLQAQISELQSQGGSQQNIGTGEDTLATPAADVPSPPATAETGATAMDPTREALAATATAASATRAAATTETGGERIGGNLSGASTTDLSSGIGLGGSSALIVAIVAGFIGYRAGRRRLV